MSWTIHRRTAFVIVIAVSFLTLLVINLFLVKYSSTLMKQPLFPRSWLNHIDRCYQTFYPSTHDGNFQNAVAVIGDSYGAGDGDEFLDGIPNYGIFHKLKSRNGERYLIYARGGFGSISAAKEIVFCMNAMNNSILLPSIGNPKKAMVLFYEGNDLNNNIRHLSKKEEGQTIESFVKQQVVFAGDWIRTIQMHAPLFNLLEELVEDLLFSLDYKEIAKQLIGDSTYAELKEIFEGHRASDSATEATITHQNQVVVADTAYAVPLNLQGAGIELSDNLDDALQVFQNSVLVLQSYFQGIPIEIVYVPSVVTCYQWKGKIQVQAYHTRDTVFTTAEDNETQSRRIRESIHNFAVKHKIRFIDTTSLLQSAAQKHFIHGPKDWKHFNSIGYQVVADAL